MQCACAILSSVDCPALQYFLHILIKGMIFEKKKVSEHKIPVPLLSRTSL